MCWTLSNGKLVPNCLWEGHHLNPSCIVWRTGQALLCSNQNVNITHTSSTSSAFVIKLRWGIWSGVTTWSVSLVGNADVMYMYFIHVPVQQTSLVEVPWRAMARAWGICCGYIWSFLPGRSTCQTKPGGTSCTCWVSVFQTGDHLGAFGCELIILLVWVFRLLCRCSFNSCWSSMIITKLTGLFCLVKSWFVCIV